MSIKSQKSLNEECSEIVERSYSVRSASDDSLSCDEEEETLALELMRKMTPAVLSKLRRCFRRSRERNLAKDIDRRVEEVMRLAAAEEGIEFARTPASCDDPLWLDCNGFVNALDGIFGHRKYTTHAHKLFQLLDPFGSGKVRWRQLVDRLVAAGARRTRSRGEEWTPVREGGVKRLEHCKRETIVKLVSIERAEAFCFVAVSRGGRVGVYSGGMTLLHSYDVFYHRTGVHRRVKNCWITDAIYMSDVQCLMLSASDRSLTVYDAATLTHTPIYCITGLPNIPTCMAYTTSIDNSELIFGTELGDLIRISFLQPRVSLFYTKSSEHINYYFWMELPWPPHSAYCACAVWRRRAHARSVRRLTYARGGQLVLSCSHDGAVSVRARHTSVKLRDYVFRVQRGVTCFHMVPTLQLLATGGRDGWVRLWSATQGAPFARLPRPAPAPAPAPAVLDVAVIAARDIVVAFCSNCWLNIWDMYEECLLQTVKIMFPFLGILGKKVEFGAFSIHPGSSRKSEAEEEQHPLPSLVPPSRRGSSVYRGSTGGLMLQTEDCDQRQSRRLEDDPEYIRFNRPELVISCCDYVCTITLTEPVTPLLPPPGDTLRAKRPSFWDLPDDVFMQRASPPPPAPPAPAPAPAPPPAQFLSPAMAAAAAASVEASPCPQQDLDTLLQTAGLQGILEKDFVMMKNLKHDLNRKLADMEANKGAMLAAVGMGAPYLALKISEPIPLGQVDEMAHEYKRVMKLFPGPSVVASPASSTVSTPRKRGSQL